MINADIFMGECVCHTATGKIAMERCCAELSSEASNCRLWEVKCAELGLLTVTPSHREEGRIMRPSQEDPVAPCPPSPALCSVVLRTSDIREGLAYVGESQGKKAQPCGCGQTTIPAGRRIPSVAGLLLGEAPTCCKETQYIHWFPRVNLDGIGPCFVIGSKGRHSYSCSRLPHPGRNFNNQKLGNDHITRDLLCTKEFLKYSTRPVTPAPGESNILCWSPQAAAHN